MFIRFILFVSFILSIYLPTAEACSSCTIPRLGQESAIHGEDAKARWFFEYLFEQKNYDKMDARDAHNLHHAGHHFHDKTTEDYHHLKFGNHLTEDSTVFVEIPYITRRSIEIDDHDILGDKQSSEGWGDLNLIGQQRIFGDQAKSFSLAVGIKFPTGSTEELNSAGTIFEPELQPGSGSYDYILGGIYQHEWDRLELTANASYVYTTRGRQEFEFGDLYSTSIFLDYVLNPASEGIKAKAGIEGIYQFETKQHEDGVKQADSGGSTLMMGPSFKLEANQNVSAFSALLFPVYQHLGGVHQETDYEWTAGGRVSF